MPHTVPEGHTAGLFHHHNVMLSTLPTCCIDRQQACCSFSHDGDRNPHTSVTGVLTSGMVVVHVESATVIDSLQLLFHQNQV